MYDYEHSELLLYQNMVIEESGDTQAALEHLEKYTSQICDKVTLLESKGISIWTVNFFMLKCSVEPTLKFLLGNYLIQANRLTEAERIYRDLINRNPEHHLYYNQVWS